MNVSAIMTRDVQACGPGDALAVAARIMRERRCGFVPVVDARRRVIGVVTDRDVCLALLRADAALTEVRVDSAMTAEVHTVRPESTVEDAERTMRAWRVRRVPVVDARGRLEGVLSIDDLARRAVEARGAARGRVTERDVARTLSRIVGPTRVIDVPAEAARVRPRR